MRHWFHQNFEDPVHETPYNSQEGGYLYIWGGPYNAHDELHSEFGSLIPDERIEEVADDIEGEDGIYDWAPGSDHPDTRQREEEWQRKRDEQEEEPPQPESLNAIIDRLKTDVRPSYGDGYELELRRAIRGELDTLRTTLAQVTPPHGRIGHNNPPPDDESPQAIVIIEVRDAGETIGRELAKQEPNALEVANATSRLQAALGWFGKKLDKTADSFASGFGKALGVAAAGAVIAEGALLIPSLVQLIGSIVQHAIQWLSHVTMPF
jgi:hypothetical protein